MDKSIYSEKHKIDIDYYHNFVKNHKEIFDLLNNNLEYYSDEESQVVIFGKAMNIPRKQVAYGEDGVTYKFSGNCVKAKNWNDDDVVSKCILNIKNRVEEKTGFKFNFCLVNMYKDENSSIGLHSDSEKELIHTNIVGVSLGEEREMIFKSNIKFKNYPDTIKLNLASGSMFIMNEPTNDNWKHSIQKTKEKKKIRISLTFRHIEI